MLTNRSYRSIKRANSKESIGSVTRKKENVEKEDLIQKIDPV